MIDIPAKCVTALLNYKPGGTVLDIGIGRGHNALFLRDKGFKVTGVDIKEVYFEGIETHQTKFEDFQTEQKFDCIIAIDVLNFLIDPFTQLARIKDMLKPNGIFIARAFTEKDPINFHFKFSQNILRDIFSDYEILTYNEFDLPDIAHDGLPEHVHNHAVLIARKIVR